MLAADGRLHGVDLATGEAKVVPPPEFVTPFSRNWSLNLVDGVLYTTVGRGCGNGPVPGAPAPPPGTIRGGGAPHRRVMLLRVPAERLRVKARRPVKARPPVRGAGREAVAADVAEAHRLPPSPRT